MIGVDDGERCKLRNTGGSECGTCPCVGPWQCKNPPRTTPMGLYRRHTLEQLEAKIEQLEAKEQARSEQ